MPKAAFPLALREQIKRYGVRRPYPPAFLAKAEEKLVADVRQLGTAIDSACAFFVFYLFDLDKALSITPTTYPRSTLEETALAMQYS